MIMPSVDFFIVSAAISLVGGTGDSAINRPGAQVRSNCI